jgi:vitamin B12 transporter
MKKLIVVLCLYTGAIPLLQAQIQDSLSSTQLKEVVVSDTKFALNKQKSGKIIEVITAQDLAKKQGQSLANVLSQLAGVEINGNQSFAGKNLGYYIRGGRNRQTAIYIDGIPVTDASGINLEYDLRLISVDQVEKIEVMKGASSTLYGTGAATGVINITLKKSSQKKLSGRVFSHIGTQNTTETTKYYPEDLNQGFSIDGTILPEFSYMTAVNHSKTMGMSEASGDQFEPDVFSRWNVMQKIGYKLRPDVRLDVFGNYDRIQNTFDNSFDGVSVNADDSNNTSLSEQYRVGMLSKYTFAQGEFALNAGASSIERVINQTNTWTGTVDQFNYFGRNVSVDGFAKYKFTSQLFLVSGVQYQFLDMAQVDQSTDLRRTDSKFNLLDPYFTVVYNSVKGLNINMGSRLNIHSEYGNQVLYTLNPSYAFSSIPLKVMGSYSTAYITPTLYQLYGPYGNLLLTPEKNATAELGFESKFFSNACTLNAVGFYRAESNTIGFYYNPDTSESFYINTNQNYNARGLETSLRYQLTKAMQLSGNYSFTQVDQAVNRLIPKHKVNLDYTYQFKKLTLNGSYQYVDQRADAYYDSNSFATTTVELPAYQLFNANVSYFILPKQLQFFASISNIFDEKFQEVIGYSARGRNTKLGLTFLF